MRDGLPSADSRDAHEGGVEDRDDENEYRDEDRTHAPTCPLHAQSQHRQHVAEEEAPTVAHEDAGRGHVVDEKARSRPGECGSCNDQCPEALEPGHEAEKDCGEDRHTRGHPVHRVEQVEGVGQPKKPDER